MKAKTLGVCVLCAWFCAIEMSEYAFATEPLTDTCSTAVTPRTDESEPLFAFPEEASVKPRRIDSQAAGVQVITSSGGTAAALPGITVYSNEIDPIPAFYPPGAGKRIADDLRLIGGACGEVVHYSLAVYADATAGATFNVQTALWNKNPCEVGAAVIPGSQKDFTGLAIGTVHILQAALDTAPVAVPERVWLAATFSTRAGGWVVAEEAEVGFTADLFYQQGAASPCLVWFPGDLYSGFWATINCNVTEAPVGACCDGTTCTEITEAECTAGTWQGPYTTCDPNPCLPGACCTGDDLTACTDTTEAGCAKLPGLFHPLATCNESPCDQGFMVYRNDAVTNGVKTIANGTLMADDQAMGPGAPCNLASFALDVYGIFGTGAYDVTVELWTNMANPVPDPDEPLEPIPGTTAVFHDLQDGAIHRLVAGPFSGITLPDQAWMVVSTSTNSSGWLIGGEAVIGSTDDSFSIYDHPQFPADTWTSFDFTDPLIWSGFRANIWCYGTMPTGACCNDAAGTCVDGLTELQCEGRWAVDASCESDPFDPPCGTNACCAVFGCQNKLTSECLMFGGVPAYGSFCSEITCPRTACLDALGDCFSANGSPGCDIPFCCEDVCDFDSACCTGSWDTACAETAQSRCELPLENDHCGNAEPVAGEGEFDFDNTIATMDGPPHEACLDAGGEPTITRDVWHCWTSPCTDTIYVRTCDLTTVDTKVAVYDDCTTCPPTDASLLDCNDDYCGFGTGDGVQSQVTFDATADQSYLIRVGTFPGANGGSGAFSVTCGPPEQPACPGTGDCCTDTGTPGCSDELCCEVVCLCDAFCCEVEWDEACSKMGVNDTGCGAQLLCPNLCGAGTCPDDPVIFLDPPNGVVDARQPYPPTEPANRQGISKITVQGSPGIDNTTCWSLCETAQDGPKNGIKDVVDNGNGTFTVNLDRSITTGAVTTITYKGKSGPTYRATFTSHPANVDADSASGAVDILKIIDYLNAAEAPPYGLHSTDVDHTGVANAADILRVIDLLNGADAFDPWLGIPKPTCGACCP